MPLRCWLSLRVLRSRNQAMEPGRFAPPRIRLPVRLHFLHPFVLSRANKVFSGSESRSRQSRMISSRCRKMVFVSYIHVLSAAFLMGLAAAAPMGPVNMLAIRRGLIGGWRHTLACGIGSVTGDLILFSLVLLGGHYLFSDLSNPTLRTVLAAIGVLVLLPLGIYFLVRAVKDPLRAFASARKRWNETTVPAHLVAEVADAAALTTFNPLTIIYWVGVTSNWLPFAHSVLGTSAPEWGILMAAAGLMTWFTALVVVVRFIPSRIGPIFFRLVNGILGLILLGFATFCAIVLSRHFDH
jgi:threonine/homoserine/homoserine lactone efflux protein